MLLAVRENAWNWPVGIANNVFFLILFWSSKLYADAVLQIVYIVISFFGWWNWLHGGLGHTELPIRKTNVKLALFLAMATAATTAALTLILHRFTDSPVPFLDGVTTALSLTAQYMLSQKLLENWWVWMSADVIYIALYAYKSLYLTGALYLLFFCLCVAGYAGWRRAFASRREIFAQEAAAL